MTMDNEVKQDNLSGQAQTNPLLGQAGNVPIPPTKNCICPNCGYCPCCGRPYRNYNYPYYPAYPYWGNGIVYY
jgi:hypothetical protein